MQTHSVQYYIVLVLLWLSANSFASAQDTLGVHQSMEAAGDKGNIEGELVAIDCKKEKQDIFHVIGRAFTRVFRNFNDIDTRYVEPQHYNYTTMLQTTYTYEAYTIKSESGQSFTLAPEPSLKIGPYIGWRWLFLGYTFDVNHLESNNKKTEFNLSLYSSMLGIDLYYRKSGDDYRIRNSSLSEKVGAGFLKDVPFGGLSVGIKGFDLYYIFNHKRFSYPAAFSQSTRQKRSCGSMLAGIGYTSHSLSLDYESLKNTVKENLQAYPDVHADEIEVDSDFDFKSVKYESFSLSVGYAYNWVFMRNCLFSASLSAAVAYKKTKSDIKHHNTTLSDFNFKNFNLDGIGRFGIVWNNDTWYAGANTVLHAYNYRKSRFSASSYFGSLNVYAGLNFGIKRKYKKKI